MLEPVKWSECVESSWAASRGLRWAESLAVVFVMNGGSKEEATIAMVVRRRCDARWQHPRVEVEKGCWAQCCVQKGECEYVQV